MRLRTRPRAPYDRHAIREMTPFAASPPRSSNKRKATEELVEEDAGEVMPDSMNREDMRAVSDARSLPRIAIINGIEREDNEVDIKQEAMETDEDTTFSVPARMSTDREDVRAVWDARGLPRSVGFIGINSEDGEVDIKQEAMEMDEDSILTAPARMPEADDDIAGIIKQSIEDEIKPDLEELEPFVATGEKATTDQLQEIDSAAYAPIQQHRDERTMLDHLNKMDLAAPARELRSAAPRDLSDGRLKTAFTSRYKSGVVTRSGFKKRVTEKGDEESVRRMLLANAKESERGQRTGRITKNPFLLEVAVRNHIKKAAESEMVDEEGMDDMEE